MDKDWAFACFLIPRVQTTFNLGIGILIFVATIGFFMIDCDWSLKFVDNPKHELWIMLGFIAIFWFVTFFALQYLKVWCYNRNDYSIRN